MINKRMSWVDIAKGIGIMLVVLGHMNVPGFIGKYIYSFHMPLFFFLSGYVFSSDKYKSFTALLKNKARFLLIPYVYFSLISVLVYFLLDNNVIIFKNELYGVLIGTGGSTALWFLVCLFMTELLYYFLSKLCKFKIQYIGVILVLSSIIGYLISVDRIMILWKIDVSFTSLVLFGIGNIVNKTGVLNIINHKNKVRLLSLFILLLLSILFCFSNNLKVDMNNSVYGNYFYFYLAALSGTLVILIISQIIHEQKLLEYIGQNTLIILFASGIIPKVSLGISSLIFSVPIVLIDSNLILKSLQRVESLVLLYFSIPIINRYFSFMLGKKSSSVKKIQQIIHDRKIGLDR